MTKLSYPVGVRLELDLHQAMKLAAADRKWSLSALIATICAEWIARLGESQPTQEPVAAEVQAPPVDAPATNAAEVFFTKELDPEPVPGLPQPVTDWMNPQPRPKPRTRQKR